MEVYLLSFVFAMCAAGATAIIAMRFTKSGAIKSPKASFVQEVSNAHKAGLQKLKKGLSLSQIQNDEVAKSLYLGGVRKIDVIKKVKLALFLSLIIPPCIATYFYLTGFLNSQFWLIGCLSGIAIRFVLKGAINSKRKKRQEDIEAQLPQFMDLLVISIESGLSFTASIPLILDQLGTFRPLTMEFNTLVHEFGGGVPMVDACERLALRCDVPSVSLVMGSIIQTEKMGTSLGNTLRTLSAELRDKYKQEIREKAMKIPTLLAFPIALMMFALFLFIGGAPVYQIVRAFSGQAV